MATWQAMQWRSLKTWAGAFLLHPGHNNVFVDRVGGSMFRASINSFR